MQLENELAWILLNLHVPIGIQLNILLMKKATKQNIKLIGALELER